MKEDHKFLVSLVYIENTSRNHRTRRCLKTANNKTKQNQEDGEIPYTHLSMDGAGWTDGQTNEEAKNHLPHWAHQVFHFLQNKSLHTGKEPQFTLRITIIQMLIHVAFVIWKYQITLPIEISFVFSIDPIQDSLEAIVYFKNVIGQLWNFAFPSIPPSNLPSLPFLFFFYFITQVPIPIFLKIKDILRLLQHYTCHKLKGGS